MTITSRFLQAGLLLVLPVAALRGQTPSPMPSRPVIVLDGARVQDTLDTIQSAADRGDLDTLCLALEKHLFDRESMDLIGTLPKPQQITLLLRILGDKKILKPAPVANYISPNDMFERTLHGMVEVRCYTVLGEPPPGFHGLLTQAEVDALAAKLRAIQ